MSARLHTVNEVASTQLDSFLCRMYPPAKSNFLQRYGAWWYGGEHNRWVLMEDEKILGYCALIPAKINMQGKFIPALWWVDLIIAPEYRGHGYQSLFDEKIRSLTDLKLGFPNELAAKVHRKHQWGVREDLQIRLLPLKPTQLRAVRHAPGAIGAILRFVTLCCSPLVNAFWGIRDNFLKPQNSYHVEEIDPQILAGVFDRFKRDDVVTTVRDAMYIQWRFLDAPYVDELVFYAVGPKYLPTHYLIARHIPATGNKYPATRILDVFGDFGNQKDLVDLFKLVTMDAIRKGSAQVTIMVTLPELKSAVIQAGFWVFAKARFCWLSQSARWMSELGSKVYWVIGDSDNDEPE